MQSLPNLASPARPLPPPAPQPLAAILEGERRRRRRRRLVWPALAIVLALGGVAIWYFARPRPVAMAARFRTQPITQGNVEREVRATGRVEAVTTVSVGAEISGRIATVEVDFNDRVTQGQVLARFDRNALVAQRAQVQATVAAARAQVAQARFDLEQATRTLARGDVLHARRAMSDQDHDTLVTAARLAASRLAAAQAQLAAQEAGSSLARTNLDHAVIRAPIDGVVITRNVEPGQTVASMLQSPVLFTVAADLRRMRVIAAVDEADIGEVKVGQRVISTVTGYPERTFPGLVTEVRNSPTVVQDVVTYGVVIVVDNPDLALRPGMTATARIAVASAVDVRRVANGALHFTPPGETRGATPEVWWLDGDRLRRTPVEPGITDGEVTALAETPATAALPDGTRLVTELTLAGRKAYGTERRP